MQQFKLWYLCTHMATSWHPHKHLCKGYLTPRQTILHGIWNRVAQHAFILPRSICSHVDAWDILDIDMACCRLCGATHACKQADCPVTESDEGDLFCTPQTYNRGLCEPYKSVASSFCSLLRLITDVGFGAWLNLLQINLINLLQINLTHTNLSDCVWNRV